MCPNCSGHMLTRPHQKRDTSPIQILLIFWFKDLIWRQITGQYTAYLVTQIDLLHFTSNLKADKNVPFVIGQLYTCIGVENRFLNFLRLRSLHNPDTGNQMGNSLERVEWRNMKSRQHSYCCIGFLFSLGWSSLNIQDGALPATRWNTFAL